MLLKWVQISISNFQGLRWKRPRIREGLGHTVLESRTREVSNIGLGCHEPGYSIIDGRGPRISRTMGILRWADSDSAQ
jgi:hypothetical protein